VKWEETNFWEQHHFTAGPLVATSLNFRIGKSRSWIKSALTFSFT